jgi:hypothetical protein
LLSRIDVIRAERTINNNWMGKKDNK